MSQSPRRSPRNHHLSPPLQKKTEKRTKLQPPPKFTPPRCEGISENVQSAIVKGWLGKKKFLGHVERVVEYIIDAQTKGDKSHKVIYSTATMKSEIDDDASISMNVCVSEDVSGQEIRWLRDYPQHYIGKFDIMPTERFFTFIEYMYQMLKTTTKVSMCHRCGRHHFHKK